MALDVFDIFMGLKDHLDDGTGHLLDLGIDLDYLHVKASASDRPPSASEADAHAKMEPGPSEEAEGRLPAGTSVGSSSGIGSTPADSEESTDSETEQQTGSARPSFPSDTPAVPPPHRSAHPQLCRSPCLDLESASPLGGSVSEDTDPEETLRAYQNKMEFALKLGYQEDLIRLVLSKLGPEALINDILGELVKLGSKPETEQGSGSSGTSQSRSSSLAPSSSSCSSSGSITSSSGCGFSDSTESHQSDSPLQMDSLDDKDNLRPIVIDGSNVAMR